MDHDARLTVRVPLDVRNAIFREARAHRRSVNEEVVALLERGLLRLTYLPLQHHDYQEEPRRPGRRV